MLQFADTPYEFYPPKPSRLFIRLLHQHNRFLNLPGKRHRLGSFSLHHAARVDAIKQDPRARVLFVANHSTHSDPQIMSEVQRRLGMPSCFMAAYDVFQRGKLNAWMMQHFGAFSVDRDGSDGKSMKTAMQVLKDGAFPLTIFPEGNVYFMNDRVCPFLDGASFIALKVQKDLGPEHPVQVVPVSIKATHKTDQRAALFDKVAGLAGELGTTLDRALPLRDELMRIGERALSRRLKELDHLPAGSDDLPFPEFLEASATPVIETLESRLALTPRGGEGTLDRIRKIRSQIHQIRIDEEKNAACPEATRWAEEAILCMRVLSYTGDYIGEKPSLDRYAETVEKLLEDWSGESQVPWAERHVYACINEPIDLRKYLDLKSRAAIGQLTTDCEQAVQSGMDELNARNEWPGGESF